MMIEVIRMPDREKVIKGLQELRGSQETMELISDAIVLIDTQYKLILELQNLISIGTKMMNGGEVDEIPGDP